MSSTTQKVWDIVLPVAKSLGLELWDVRYLKEGASWFLRIFIDKEEGITIEDCEALSRAVDQPLDDADPIKEAYYLEVSSPGLNRELTRPEHFEKFLGSEVYVKLFKAIEGQKKFFGVLQSYTLEEIVLDNYTFNINQTSKIRLCEDKDLI